MQVELVLGLFLDEQERPIAFASRSFSPSENNYPISLHSNGPKLTRFGIMCSVQKFIIRTDNNSLTYILSTAKLDATRQCWVAELSQSDFYIKYHSGKEIVMLTYFQGYHKLVYTISLEMVSTICQQHSAFPWSYALQLSSDTKPPFCSPQPSASPYWKEEQSKDHVISTVNDILSHRLHIKIELF